MTSDLIVFGEDWGGLPSSTQHLVKRLRETRKILWVNSIGLRKPRLNLADSQRVLQKLRSPARKKPRSPEPPHENFTILNPLTIPAPVSAPARWLARRMLRRQLRAAIHRAGLHRPLLWMSLPTAADMVGQLDETGSVYYCGDDFSALAGVDHATAAAREAELCAKADLIITASENLQHRFPANKTQLLTHGVDYRLFSTPIERSADLPANGKPTAGFYGSLSEWFDTELMSEVARRMPHWNFVFVGRICTDLSSLASLGNVYFPGPRAHAELPGFSQHWDVSLLPFRDNAQIRACNPLKLAEYLAAGKPVVSTAFPAVEAYRPLVSITDGSEQMIAGIEISRRLARCAQHRERLRTAVSQQSWEARAARVSAWLESL